MTGPADEGPSAEDIDNAYQQALVQVRQRLGSLNTEVAAQLDRALRDWADQLEAGVADLPEQRAYWAIRSAELTRETADDLAARVVDATQQSRTLAYEDTLDIWRQAMVRLTGDDNAADTLLGTLRVPSLSLLNQFASLNAAAHWKTLIKGDAEQAATEANDIILQGLTSGIGPEELAQRLRRYVDGAGTFASLFHDVELPDGTFARLNLNRIPRAMRGAGWKVDYNARRIAYTELHNARAEAEVQYFRADPLVGAVRWTLAPDRGTQVLPDECDLLARANWYGLGPGIYPVDNVPAPPHPFDRCERLPVPRAWATQDDPKDQGSWSDGAWREVSYLGRGMRKSSWLNTVADALQALALGRAA